MTTKSVTKKTNQIAKPVDGLPPAILRLGPEASEHFFNFFTAEIRNANTRAAYHRNACRFMDWLDGQGVALEEHRPMHVSAYVEMLGRSKEEGGAGYSPASVKQHLAALKVLGNYLVIKQVLPSSPAAAVRGPKHVVTVGKTPAFENKDARHLFASIDTAKPAGLRDRALLGVMVYSFGRISAVLALDVSDYYQAGRRMRLRFLEKGGREHEMPAHHLVEEYLGEYLDALKADSGPLFRSINASRDGFTDRRLNRREALAMVKRRTKRAGLGDRFTNHSFRATGITAYLKNEGQLEHAQYMAGHASPRTTKLYDRRAQEASLDEVQKIIL